MTELPQIQPGTVLQNRYRILGAIARGRYGWLYQARDLYFANVTRLCTVKELNNSAQDEQLREQMLRAFEAEAEILAILSHPAMPFALDYLSFPDRAFLVMEFIQGRDLESLLNGTDRFFPVEQILTWAIELCSILNYLHTHQGQVVFGDMRPAHVMIDHLRNVRLVGFGSVIFRPAALPNDGGYSPPEHERGIFTPEGDIYGLGATLHHLLTRRDPRLEPPFTFDQRPIHEINPAVSREFEAVVMQALKHNPEERFPSAIAMKEALEAVRGD